MKHGDALATASVREGNEIFSDARSSLSEAAAWYVSSGFPIFPLHSVLDGNCSCGRVDCSSPGKHPRVRRGFKDASIDSGQIAAWWQKWPHANIGVVTGAASQLLVIDVDPRNGGQDSLDALFAEFGPFPTTAVQLTGGGGKHFVFRQTGQLRCCEFAKGIDIKADGGYIVAAPSTHLSGQIYRWEERERLLRPEDPPEWLIKNIAGRPFSGATKRPLASACWQKGNRNRKLTSVAGNLRRQGISRNEIAKELSKENRHRCHPPLPEEEVQRIAHSVARYEPAVSHSPFLVTDEGVFYRGENNGEGAEAARISARVDVVGKTRDGAGHDWGRLLHWQDDEGRQHQWAMPMELLASDSGAVRAQLLGDGLPYLTTNTRLRERFAEYLQTAPAPEYLRSVARIGWEGDVYVLPDLAIGSNDGERVFYQTPHPTDHHWKLKGTAEQWRDQVGKPCSGNSRLVLAVSCGFAGPLLSLAGGESGGIHFVGSTSTGKSTALIVAGSVCGGGGPSGFVQTWRTTINGLEAIAEGHNDGTLFLDELAQVDPSQAGETAYLLGNGQGKARMSRSIGARKRLSWRLLFVSAGELTLAEHSATAGKRTRGGAEIRLLNVEADAGRGLGLFEHLHGSLSPDVFARSLKEAALACYGAPFRAFVQGVAADISGARAALANVRTAFFERFVAADANGEIKRAAQRFSIIAASGELATKYRLTSWRPDEALEAAGRCLKEWVDRRGTTGGSDMEVAIRQVRRFLEAHGASRFEPIGDVSRAAPPAETSVFPNRAGFRRTGPESDEIQFLVLPETFQAEICVGHAARAVLHELDRRGLLIRNAPEMTIKPRLPGLGLVRVYCIRAAIFEAVPC